MGIHRVLITSLGSIGRRHLSNVRDLLPSAKIGVLRLTDRPLSAGSLPDEFFASIEEAIAFHPDMAIIASPATEHLTLASALVGNGVATLVEKPFAATPDGLSNLIEQAQTRGVPLRIAYNLRYHPLLRRVRELINSGAIGRVVSVRAEVGQYLPDWRPNTRYQDGVSANAALGGGALLELSHELDYLYWMFGLPAVILAVGGTLGDLGIGVEDMVSLLMHYPRDRRIVSVHLDFLQRAANRSCKLVGTEGTMVADLLIGRLDRFDASDKQWSSENLPLSDANQTYRDELKAFVSSIDGGACDLPDGRGGLDVMNMIETARMSLPRPELEPMLP